MLLQLGDDLQDVRDDLRGSMTLFSGAASEGRLLDGSPSNLEVQRIGDRMDQLPGETRFQGPIKDELKSLIIEPWRTREFFRRFPARSGTVFSLPLRVSSEPEGKNIEPERSVREIVRRSSGIRPVYRRQRVRVGRCYGVPAGLVFANRR